MILVTGGTGYIGSHTVVELLNEGLDVFIIDNLSNSSEIVIDRIEEICGKRPLFLKAPWGPWQAPLPQGIPPAAPGRPLPQNGPPETPLRRVPAPNSA